MLQPQEGERGAHPPVGEVAQGAQVQSLDSMNSGLNNSVSRSGQLKRSAVFELATREETEADKDRYRDRDRVRETGRDRQRERQINR